MIKNKKKFILINKLVLILNLVVIVLFLIYICKLFFLGSNHFLIKKVNINVYGNNLASKSELKIKEIIDNDLIGNILIVDLDKVRNKIEHLKWIDSVTMRRVWPSSIDIFIRELRPIARFNDCCLLDNQGNILNVDTDDFLPIFETDDGIYDEDIINIMIDYFNKFNNELEKNNIYIQKLKLNNIFSWSILLKDGLLIKLGKDNVLDKISRFIKIWNLSLKNNKNNIIYIDMRYDDGFVVFYRN